MGYGQGAPSCRLKQEKLRDRAGWLAIFGRWWVRIHDNDGEGSASRALDELFLVEQIP
jgi:hypothetical protein